MNIELEKIIHFFVERAEGFSLELYCGKDTLIDCDKTEQFLQDISNTTTDSFLQASIEGTNKLFCCSDGKYSIDQCGVYNDIRDEEGEVIETVFIKNHDYRQAKIEVLEWLMEHE